jgi:pimeloyl-ACP methyl ester carboxylesterase
MRLLAAFALGVAAPAIAEPFDAPVPLEDGRVLNLWCEGRRGQVVVFDSGWAADSRAWRRVMAGLSDSYRVCAQDRAGQGRSSPGPMPRDGEAVARDLHAALTRGSVPKPWVLVGHSLGGLNMRHFVRLYPADVAGLVLVDPTSPTGPGAFGGQVARASGCVEALKSGVFPPDRPELARCKGDDPDKALARWDARLSEIESVGRSTSEGLKTQGLGSVAVPLIVLRPGGQGKLPEGQTFADPLARLSVAGEARLIEGSGHMMMFDRPDAIVQAVQDVLKAASPDRKEP